MFLSLGYTLMRFTTIVVLQEQKATSWLLTGGVWTLSISDNTY